MATALIPSIHSYGKKNRKKCFLHSIHFTRYFLHVFPQMQQRQTDTMLNFFQQFSTKNIPLCNRISFFSKKLLTVALRIAFSPVRLSSFFVCEKVRVTKPPNKPVSLRLSLFHDGEINHLFE